MNCLLQILNTPNKAIASSVLIDILCDLEFYNFKILYSTLGVQSLKDDPAFSLLEIFNKGGYSNFLEIDWSLLNLSPCKLESITTKLKILDLIDASTDKSWLDFPSCMKITHTKSTEELIDFLILALSTKVLNGKINIQKNCLLISSLSPRDSYDLEEIELNVNHYTLRIMNSIRVLEKQEKMILEKTKSWKEQDKEYQESLKRVSDLAKKRVIRS